jgi:hypothetical protein
MKKLLVLLVVGLLAVTSLTGCAAPKTYKFGTGSFTEVAGRAAVAALKLLLLLLLLKQLLVVYVLLLLMLLYY